MDTEPRLVVLRNPKDPWYEIEDGGLSMELFFIVVVVVVDDDVRLFDLTPLVLIVLLLILLTIIIECQKTGMKEYILVLVLIDIDHCQKEVDLQFVVVADF